MKCLPQLIPRVKNLSAITVDRVDYTDENRNGWLSQWHTRELQPLIAIPMSALGYELQSYVTWVSSEKDK